MIGTLRSRLTRLSGVAVLSLATMAAISGCSDDDTAVTPTTDFAQLRALHLSPDAGNVDVFVNGTRSVSALGFQAGTGYLDVAAGETTLDVAPTGSAIGASVLSVPGLTLQKDVRYTAVAYNTVNAISALALVDDLNTPPAGQIRVRAVHTAAGVNQVDIWNIPGSGNPSPLYTDVDRGVAGDYLELPAGAYTLGFDVNNDATPDLTFSLPSLPAGTVANVFAVAETGGAVFLLAQFADGTVARIDAN